MTPLRDLLESIVTLTKIWKRDRALKPIETKLARQMAKAFRAHRAVFMREFERVGPRILGEASTLPAIEGALEAAYQATLADFLAPIEEAAGAAIAAAAKHRVAEFGVSFAFDLKNPRAVSGHQERRRPQPSPTSTRPPATRSPGSCAKGWRTATTIRRWPGQIVAKYDEFAVRVTTAAHIRNRAELIAVTEAAEAYETGNRLVIDEMTAVGLEMEMSWSTVGDERVSEGCIANAAVGWIPVDQLFPSGHQHPPRFPGCRCATLYRRRPTT